MIKRLISITLFSILYSINCGTSVQMLPEPLENKNLLIGSIIFDVNGYQDNFLTVQDKIEVAIVGSYEEYGRIKNFGQWASTDEDGHFYIANVPDGEYAIKGFKVFIMGIGDLKIQNDLNNPQRNYFELRNQEIINFGASLFDTQSNQRIVNLKHNVFTIYHNEIIDFKRYDRLRDLKLSTGEIVDSPPVPSSFIEKFEGSGWENYLTLQL